MSGESLIRIAAGLAAVALAFAPVGVAAAAKAKAWWHAQPAAPGAPGVTVADMHEVLALAGRLRAAGCYAGVDLCNSLLRLMMAGCPGAPPQKGTE